MSGHPVAAPVDDLVDGLTRLCQGGHTRLARTLAERELAADRFRGSLALATVAGATHDRATLEASLAEARSLDPAHPAVLRASAGMSALAGDAEAARAAARAAARVDPSPRSLNGLARLLLSLGHRDEAVAILERLANERGDADAHMQLATLGGTAEVALDHYVSAFLQAPTEPHAMQAIMTQFREGSWPIGVAVLAQHVRGTTASPGLRFVSDLVALAARLYMKGTALDGLVQTPASLFANARLAAQAMPIAAQLVLAGLFLDHGRIEDGRTLLTSLANRLATASDRAHHAFLEGRLAQAAGKPELAAERYAAALSHDPHHADAACNLISALVAQGTPEAFAEIGSVLTSIPELERRLSPMLTYNEASWLELRGKRDDALALVDFLEGAPLGVMTQALHAMRARLTARAVS